MAFEPSKVPTQTPPTPPHQPPANPGKKPEPGKPGEPKKEHEEAGSPPEELTAADEEDPLGAVATARAERLLQAKAAKKVVEKIQAMTEEMAEEIELTGSIYSYRGRCKHCGWQTFQMDQEDAHDLVKRHAAQHWHEAMLQQQAPGESSHESA
jgi:hypothetical protein